jgi:hypothetical protein
MPDNGHLQVVVADFEERQCPTGHDGQERSRDNAHHCTRNAICNLLTAVFLFYSSNMISKIGSSSSIKYKYEINLIAFSFLPKSLMEP